MGEWGEVKARLEQDLRLFNKLPHVQSDIRAALQRVEELEQEKITFHGASVWADRDQELIARAKAAEAKLARLTNAVESYRKTYLVSMSGTHLGDPAVEIFAAAAKGEK